MPLSTIYALRPLTCNLSTDILMSAGLKQQELRSTSAFLWVGNEMITLDPWVGWTWLFSEIYILVERVQPKHYAQNGSVVEDLNAR
jgi:hypothetical protein